MTEMYRNHIIAQLSAATYAALLSRSRVISVRSDQELALFGSASSYAYFPETALLSLSQVLPGAEYTELMTVGCEGMLTAPTASHSQANLVAQVLVPGTVLRIAQTEMRAIAAQHNSLQRLLNDEQDTTLQQLFQVIACYRHHTITQQLSRLLLNHDDRFPQQPIVTTHAKLARRLGVRREAVSTVAGMLQKMGALEYQRGRIARIERGLLLTCSCSCYEVLHNLQARHQQRLPHNVLPNHKTKKPGNGCRAFLF